MTYIDLYRIYIFILFWMKFVFHLNCFIIIPLQHCQCRARIRTKNRNFCQTKNRSIFAQFCIFLKFWSGVFKNWNLGTSICKTGNFYCMELRTSFKKSSSKGNDVLFILFKFMPTYVTHAYILVGTLDCVLRLYGNCQTL